MRIIGGFHKGRKIKSVPGKNTRPTTDFVREALFNIINKYIAGSKFLDLFAGTGAVGLEALSRGAENVVFVERDLTACKVIGQNLRDLKLSHKSKIIQGDVALILKKILLRKQRFDIIFMDPPYFKNQIEKTLSILRTGNVVKSIIVVQHPKNELFKIEGFTCYKHKKYGRTALTFLTKE